MQPDQSIVQHKIQMLYQSNAMPFAQHGEPSQNVFADPYRHAPEAEQQDRQDVETSLVPRPLLQQLHGQSSLVQAWMGDHFRSAVVAHEPLFMPAQHAHAGQSHCAALWIANWALHENNMTGVVVMQQVHAGPNGYAGPHPHAAEPNGLPTPASRPASAAAAWSGQPSPSMNGDAFPSPASHPSPSGPSRTGLQSHATPPVSPFQTHTGGLPGALLLSMWSPAVG